MVLALDTLARIVAQEVGDRQFERLTEIKRYINRTVSEITRELRKGVVLQAATLDVTNNEVVLPDDTFAVLKISDSSARFFEVVDNDEFRSRELRTSTLPTAQVFEDVPNWRIKLLNFTDAVSAVTVDHLIVSKDPGFLPTYYEDLIIEGTKAKYHLNRSSPDRAQLHAQEFKRLMDQFNEDQAVNDGKINQMKGLAELEISDPSSSLFAHTRNDFLHPGGIF